jgi:hypothetical protein
VGQHQRENDVLEKSQCAPKTRLRTPATWIAADPAA